MDTKALSGILKSRWKLFNFGEASKRSSQTPGHYNREHRPQEFLDSDPPRAVFSSPTGSMAKGRLPVPRQASHRPEVRTPPESYLRQLASLASGKTHE